MIATVETFPVVFKLLATLRMIIDGQTEAALKVSRVVFIVVVPQAFLLNIPKLLLQAVARSEFSNRAFMECMLCY